MRDRTTFGAGRNTITFDDRAFPVISQAVNRLFNAIERLIQSISSPLVLTALSWITRAKAARGPAAFGWVSTLPDGGRSIPR